jgi:hypothetical protein
MIRLYNDRKNIGKIIARIALLLLWVIICLACAVMFSCSTIKRVPVIHYRDSIHTVESIDSIIYHDSIYESKWMQGDTVYLYKYIYKYKDRLSIRHDTCAVIKRDSVSYKVTERVEKIVYRQNKGQKALCWLGGIVLISALGYFIYKKRKYIIKVIRLFI